MSDAGQYRTDDMTLATVLAMAGYSYRLMEFTQSKAFWVFVIPSEKEEDFEDLMMNYEELTYKIEVRKFVSKLAEIRKELFDFLPNSRRRQSGTPAPATQ